MGDAATSERCVRAAERGFARYVELLAHPQPDVREWAAKLVAWFPKRARPVQGITTQPTRPLVLAICEGLVGLLLPTNTS